MLDKCKKENYLFAVEEITTIEGEVVSKGGEYYVYSLECRKCEELPLCQKEKVVGKFSHCFTFNLTCDNSPRGIFVKPKEALGRHVIYSGECINRLNRNKIEFRFENSVTPQEKTGWKELICLLR